MITTIFVLTVVSGTVLIFFATAQTEPQDRIFVKSFCANEDSLLSDIRYTDDTELSYDSSGCPESVKVIHRWNELRITDQNVINSRMTVNGYIDKTTSTATELSRGNPN